MKVKEQSAELKEGFTDRPIRRDDLEAVTKVINDSSEAMIGIRDYSAQEVAADWKTPGLDLENDLRVVLSPEGKIVGYMEVWANKDIPVTPWVWGRVHPDYEGLGIATFLMTWAEARARQVIDKVPREAKVEIQSQSVSTYQPAKDLLAGYGMKLYRYTFQMHIEMEQSPPEPKWPKGITVRPYRHPEDLEAVYRTDDEAFQDHFGYVEETFETGLNLFGHWAVNDEAFDPKLWFLAYDGDEIAGISLCRKWAYEGKDTGWVGSLAVRRPWRRQGLGLALLQHSFNAYWERGQKKVSLGVDAENLTGALRLYERAGMSVHRQYDRYSKVLRPGVELKKVALIS